MSSYMDYGHIIIMSRYEIYSLCYIVLKVHWGRYNDPRRRAC